MCSFLAELYDVYNSGGFGVSILLLKFINTSKKILSQAATLLLYLTSAIFGTLAGGNIGTIPWTMKSMSLNFMQAMDYIWPMLLICSAISISAFIFACFLVNTKKPNNLDPVGA